MPRDSYTRYPRPILWLLREGEIEIGGDGDDALPRFRARIGAFYISKLPVTNRQLEAFDPLHVRRPTAPGDDDPAVGVSFDTALGYCRWYAGVARKPIRLPTEVEWEYACRGGAAIEGDAAHGAGEAPAPARPRERVPEASRLARNPVGLVGMLGAVWQWTASLHRPYPVVDGDGRDDPDAPGPRVLRGGSFRTAPLHCGARRGAARDLTDDDVGFRIVRSFR